MEIEVPTNCPSCGHQLESTELELFCRNTENCPAQGTKKIQHFCKAMKIKGLGEKRIVELQESIENLGIFDLYHLTLSQLEDILGSSIGRTVYDNIQHSKKVEPEVLLSALGIPKVGKTASKHIMNQVGNDFENLYKTQYEKGKVGNVVLESLLSWLETSEYERLLEVDWEFNVVEVPQTEVKQTICITGKLNDYTSRKAAEDYLTSLGYVCKASVTRDVTVLICEDGKESSSSYKKALEKGITITTIKHLLSLGGN